jgi:hypothetical protein
MTLSRASFFVRDSPSVLLLYEEYIGAETSFLLIGPFADFPLLPRGNSPNMVETPRRKDDSRTYGGHSRSPK